MPLIGTVATGNTGAGNTGLNVFPMTMSTTVAAGKTLIGAVAFEAGSGTNPPNLVTVGDTHSNSYTVDAKTANGTTVNILIFSCRLTTQINTNDQISVTLGAGMGTRTRWVGTVQAFDDILSGTRVDKSTTNFSSGSALSSGTTAATTAANELIYGAFGMGVQTFTAGSGFTASGQQATTASGQNRAVNSEWKYVTATGTQTATATLGASSTWAGAIVTYKASATNVPPTANAGPDQTVTVSTTVQLDGSGSSDTDGTITGYSWTQISGTAVTLSSSTVVNPTFTAPASPATLVFGLTVTDNNGATSTQDQVTITVANKIGYVGAAVGATSTTSATTMTPAPAYAKTIPAGHTVLLGVTIDCPAGSNFRAALTAVDSKGNTYTMDTAGMRDQTLSPAILSCTLTTGVTTSDTITITDPHPRGRWAVSGAEFDNIHSGGLDVTAVNDDPPGTITALTVGPTATTQNQVEVVFATFGFGTASANTATAGTNFSAAGAQQSTGTTSGHRGVFNEYRIFTAAAAQTATASLSPGSGYAASIATYAADLISDTAPVANAGSNQTVAAFDTVTLDGTGSTDADGNVTGWSWSQTAGPTVTLSSATVAQPTFTAPGVNGGTSLTFNLVVTDNLGTNSTNPANVTITVNSAESFIAHSSAWVGMPEYAAHAGTWS